MNEAWRKKSVGEKVGIFVMSVPDPGVRGR